ncbi:hypothetical protein [uncultured Brevibacillus sp.]|uniref:hypothetical protein n=1 Tax=uncultured Brevibacillus sp. TaxID=169970 RepID=UPI002593D2A8|nr:hypothetical protein [uncultured Brevibacillus sp.]
MVQNETKHTTFNLVFKEHAVFKDKQIIEDIAGDVFLWIDKDTGKTSFGGKYFRIYDEQKLVQALDSFTNIAHDFIENVQAGKEQNPNLFTEFKSALEFAEKITETTRPMKFFEIHSPYYALLKAKTQEEAIAKYAEQVADDDGTLHEEIKEVDRDYALVSFSRGATEDKEEVPISEILKDFQSEGSSVLLIDSGLV